jgi:hypothetical protein
MVVIRIACQPVKSKPVVEFFSHMESGTTCEEVMRGLARDDISSNKEQSHKVEETGSKGRQGLQG